MRLDSDQQAIIDAACQLSEIHPEQRDPADAVINVQAVAGAGKSLIVTDLTRRLATASFLFLCKSDNIADRARATLPPSVTIQTFRQAAHRFLSITHGKKVTRDAALPIRLSDYALRVILEEQVSPQDLPLIRRALTRFYTDSGRTVEPAHVMDAMQSLGYDTDSGRGRSRQSAILSLARIVWGSQTRRDADSAPICQNAAMKIWSMGRNELTRENDETGDEVLVSASPLGDADVIVVEEAQDLDAAQIGFLGRQSRVTLMFGDDMQSLDLDAPYRHQEHGLQQRGHNFTLTRSYRFSGDLPRLLTDLREKEHGSDVEPAEGVREPETQIIPYAPDTLGTWMNTGTPVTVIAPSVIELMTLTLLYPHATVGWVDGLTAPHYHFSMLFDLACLAEPPDSLLRQHIQNPHLRQYPDLDTACDAMHRRGARFAAMMGDWVMTNSHANLAHHLRQLHYRETEYQRRMVENAETTPAPALTLTTVAAAKGHEWPTVAVVDAMAGNVTGSPWYCEDDNGQRQIRWLYTAASRAEHTLMMPQQLLAHFEQHGRPSPATPASQAIPATAEDSDHPHFGLSRHRVLEMSSESREARRQQFASQRQQGFSRTVGKGASGHQRIKQKMNESAQQEKGMSAKDHLNELKKLTTIIK